VGGGGRNDPNIVCTYELKKKKTNNKSWQGCEKKKKPSYSYKLVKPLWKSVWRFLKN
jgi:hypothetical protein